MGTQTAGLLCGVSRPGPAGGTAGITLEYDGSSWTTGGTLPQARNRIMTGGTQTAGIAFGGLNPPSTFISNNDFYDGSTWTASTALGTGRYQGGGGGDQTAAIAVSGSASSGADTQAVEEFTGAGPKSVSLDVD